MENINTCISYLASASAKSVARLSRARLAPFGITPIQFAVMQMIYEAEGASASEVGSSLSVDSATIVGVIDRLQAMDLVERKRSSHDRRKQPLFLTARGAEVLPGMQDAMNTLNREVDEALGDAAENVRQSLERLSSLSPDLGKE